MSLLLAVVVVAAFILFIVGAIATWMLREGDITGKVLGTLMLVAAVGVLTFGFLRNSRGDKAARIAVVASYLDAIRSGDFDAAYRKLCRSNRERETLQAFAERQKARPRLRDYEIVGQPRQEGRRMQLGGPVIIPPAPDPIEVELRFADGTSRKARFESPDPDRFREACVGDG